MGKTSDFVNIPDQGLDSTDTPSFAGMGDLSKSINSNNSVMIAGAGNATMTGNYQALIGFEAGLSIVAGANNTFIGYLAGRSNTNGFNNTIIGNGAGYHNQTGTDNFIVGSSAGFGVTANSYSNNCFIGYQTGNRVTTGGDNTFIGFNAGFSNTTGGGNTFIGKEAGYYNQSGTYNFIAGYEAGKGVTGNSHSNNAFIGYRAGYAITTGYQNIGIGQNSAGSLTAGHDNIFLGNLAGLNISTGDDNICIGNSAKALSDTNNGIAIGQTAVASHTNSVTFGLNGLTKAANQFHIGSATTGMNLDVTGDITSTGLSVSSTSTSVIDFVAAGTSALIQRGTNCYHLLDNSTIVSNGSSMGYIYGRALDSGSSVTSYAYIHFDVVNNTATNEDGRVRFNIIKAGTLTDIMNISGTGIDVTGNVDASTYSVGATAGAVGGTFTSITSITVTNGIVTAITGT